MATDGHLAGRTRTRTLRTHAELSAYLHRTRMAILDALRAGPATSSQVAARLGVHPANLTRHLRTLVAAGLIEPAGTRDTGRNLEKYYTRSADRFVVEPDDGGLTAPHAIALAFLQSQLAAALVRLPDEVDGPVRALSLHLRLGPDRARAFADELAQLAERYSADEEDGAPFEAVLALYPGEEPTGTIGDGPSDTPGAPGTARVELHRGARSGQ